MKICFVCDSIYSYGGVQRVLAVIAKELSKTHDVSIMTLDNPYQQKEDIYLLGATRVHILYYQFAPLNPFIEFTHKPYSYLYKKYLPKNKTTSYIYARSSFPKRQRQQLINALNIHAFDVIIGVHAFLSIKLATIRKGLTARLVIGWMHNSYQAFFENTPSYLDHLKEHFKYQMQKLDKVIVLTHSDAELYQRNLGLKPIVIYNPLTLIPGPRCDIQSKTFLSVGRMSPLHKGLDLLIKAFALFAQHDKEWKLIIVGDGPEKEQLQNLINENRLNNRVHLHPFTDNIQSYYSTASIYVLSSRWEGFPLVLMEAIAHGLPIIASDIPVCQEFLSNTTFSTLFKSESIESLAATLTSLSQSTNLQEYSDQAMEFSQKHNTIDSIMNTWNRILKEKAS